MFWAVLLMTLFLAYANGSNDNFKGVATLYGSKTANFKQALIWTSITSTLGSLLALYLASELLIVFKGVGLVPEFVMSLESFPIAVGLGAGVTVILATLFGLPVSTTHALVGALAGAGFAASSGGINWTGLSSKFFLPLIAGPLFSLVLAALLYPLLKKLRASLDIEPETLIYLDKKVIARLPLNSLSHGDALKIASLELSLPVPALERRVSTLSTYSGSIFSISAKKILDVLHYLSAGLVCFSRGLNDTPKIAALLLIGPALGKEVSILLVGVFILVGGLIQSKKIAKTMGEEITEMNPGQAFSANLITGFMVFFASKWGVPVSTTHVSCGSIFGIGAVTKQAKWQTIKKILLAWMTTLPLGFILGLLAMYALELVL
ncbi:MAG: inorganic phosphate transporter [Halobacteriovoraceae bacterium]|jgi:inorganic phosphate transporter, PiT family|nr:inorganic phosphate transporter [Halobacteriovoraceae bacterium]MBT5095670.1 inorganic phosphate transporter [Halobacteriovoraceae bacterium]